MVIQVYDERVERQQQPVILKLRNHGSGVEVVVVDDNGGVLNTLLRFNGEGTITMAGSVNTAYGFKQRGDGTIVIKGSHY